MHACIQKKSLHHTSLAFHIANTIATIDAAIAIGTIGIGTFRHRAFVDSLLEVRHMSCDHNRFIGIRICVILSPSRRRVVRRSCSTATATIAATTIFTFT